MKIQAIDFSLGLGKEGRNEGERKRRKEREREGGRELRKEGGK